jgi:hypothetical protein
MNMKKYIIVLLFCIISAPVFAVNGGVQISAVTVDCADTNKDADVFDRASQARLWISVPSGAQTDDLSFTITDQGKTIVNPTNLKVAACGDGYFFGDIALPNSGGTMTIVVEHGDGTKVGSDSFRLR